MIVYFLIVQTHNWLDEFILSQTKVDGSEDILNACATAKSYIYNMRIEFINTFLPVGN